MGYLVWAIHSTKNVPSGKEKLWSNNLIDVGLDVMCLFVAQVRPRKEPWPTMISSCNSIEKDVRISQHHYQTNLNKFQTIDKGLRVEKRKSKFSKYELGTFMFIVEFQIKHLQRCVKREINTLAMYSASKIFFTCKLLRDRDSFRLYLVGALLLFLVTRVDITRVHTNEWTMDNSGGATTLQSSGYDEGDVHRYNNYLDILSVGQS